MSNISPRFAAELYARTYNALAEHPEMRAEAIANHYASHAAVAMQLRELVRARRTCQAEDGHILDQAIGYLTEQIANHHRGDFGIELAWV